MAPAAPTIETDAVVIGAGPVGLFQVFELGLLGLRVELVDALPILGGQCALLYPEKPIYDIPGTPVCSGRELVERLARQIEPFGAGLHLDQEVSVVERRANGGFRVQTRAGTCFETRAIVVAGGVGAFQPRRLKVDGLDAFEGTQLFHRFDADAAAAAFADQRVLIVGDADAALLAALALAEPGACRQVTLVHRREEFKAEAGTVARVAAARAEGRLGFVAAQVTGFETAAGRLAAVTLSTAAGTFERLAVDRLLVLQGLSPRLGPIADWGLALDRKQVVVDTAKFESSTPGIFAVGDVNTYAGKRKLIVCGFHEATLAAFGVAAYVGPDPAVPLEYTTTSARLQRRLRVLAPKGG